MTLHCLHCPAEFREPPVPIIGEPKEVRLARLLEQAGKHMQARHPQHFPLAQWLGQIGWLAIATNVKTDEEDLKRQRSLACAEFVRLFGRVLLDKDIRMIVDKARRQPDGTLAETLDVNTVTRLLIEQRNWMRYDELFPQEPPPPVEMRRVA